MKTPQLIHLATNKILEQQAQQLAPLREAEAAAKKALGEKCIVKLKEIAANVTSPDDKFVLVWGTSASLGFNPAAFFSAECDALEEARKNNPNPCSYLTIKDSLTFLYKMGFITRKHLKDYLV